jgi:hypothetical protein
MERGSIHSEISYEICGMFRRTEHAQKITPPLEKAFKTALPCCITVERFSGFKPNNNINITG